jgi:hypothetical protein
MNRRQLFAAALAAPALLRTRGARALEPVDVELVLAVDASRSVDAEEMQMQMRGYAAAFRQPDLQARIRTGHLGVIAVTLFTWADWNYQQLVVPWTMLDGPESCEKFAGRVEDVSISSGLYTSISGAIDYACRLFGQGFEGTRRVLDVSGDGHDNHSAGRSLADARSDALRQRVVINGLAVLDRSPPPPGLGAQQPLDEYFREHVIGGPGAFLMVAEGYKAFEQAVRRKIIREMAAVPPPGPLVERANA